MQVGLFRMEVKDFPTNVFQEAILNAICHRDYSSNGAIFVKHYNLIAKNAIYMICVKMKSRKKEGQCKKSYSLRIGFLLCNCKCDRFIHCLFSI